MLCQHFTDAHECSDKFRFRCFIKAFHEPAERMHQQKTAEPMPDTNPTKEIAIHQRQRVCSFMTARP